MGGGAHMYVWYMCVIAMIVYIYVSLYISFCVRCGVYVLCVGVYVHVFVCKRCVLVYMYVM